MRPAPLWYDHHMASMVTEVYDALRTAGMQERPARALAEAVGVVERPEQLATKADLAVLRAELRQDMATLKADLTWRILTTMIAMTAVFSAIVKLT
jgi:hypothetical protein